jgi:hypothetical protein
MKATLKTGAAGLDVEAIDGAVCLTFTKLIQQPGQPDQLQSVSTVLTTAEAGSFADVFVAVACIAEEQAYHRDIERTFAAIGIPAPARDLDLLHSLVQDAAGLADLQIPAYLKPNGAGHA